VRFFRTKTGIAATLLIVLLALFLIRPGAQRLRSRIAASISLALGRQVEIERVQLHVLPQPGFDFENFVVHDDPAFGAEPMLRAQEVSATVRLTSLLRGRLEIARLNLSEPSLNLVRNGAGHWNLENLLERATLVPIVLGKSRAEAKPGFPYIEADHGRINLKLEQEKKPYALTEADFALWQDSENQWGMRLKARPVRTDFNLGDTGSVAISGTWQRAESLRRTPVNFSVQWEGGQLGQLTQLIKGADQGWRGTTEIRTAITGTPESLDLQTDASIQDFRRFDVLGSGSMQLVAHCAAHYSAGSGLISQVECHAPAGGGTLTLSGEVALSATTAYDLRLLVTDVPLASAVNLARHAKKNMPDDLGAEGTLQADFAIRRRAGEAQATWDGSGEAADVRIGSETTKTQLAVDKIPFTALRRGDHTPHFIGRIDIGPTNLALGRPVPTIFQGWVSSSGYAFSLQGDADVRRVLQLARTVGLPASQPAAAGSARLGLRITGDWSDFAPALVSGTAQLKAVHVELPGFNSPLEIAGANVLLAPNGVTVQNLSASLADTKWSGWLEMPRHCSISPKCPVQFDLRADQVVTERLAQLVNPNVLKRPWYRWLAPASSKISWLAGLRASGKIAVSRFAIHSLNATKVAAKIDLQEGRLHASDIRAELFGGKHQGEWLVDFTAKPPRYTGSGNFDSISLELLSEWMKDGWVTGKATASYRVAASGQTIADLAGSADGNLKFEAREGSFPHIVLTGAANPLMLHRMTGRLALHEGKFSVEEGKLETPGGIYQVSGTASLGRNLDIQMRDGAHGFSVTGSISEPRVGVVVPPETQAALKP
jgi:hypothetical protein